MQIIKYIYIFIALVMGMGCSNVKLALYDNEKRQEYAIETKKAFSISEAGKEIALKNAMVETARKSNCPGHPHPSRHLLHISPGKKQSPVILFSLVIMAVYITWPS